MQITTFEDKKLVYLSALRSEGIIPKTATDIMPIFKSTPRVTQELVNKILNFFVSKSSVTNDHNQFRHYKVISEVRVKREGKHGDLALLSEQVKFPELQKGLSRKGVAILKHPKRILASSFYEMFNKFSEQNQSVRVSYMLFMNCKPFFVSKCTNREILFCVCYTCHNVFNGFKVLDDGVQEEYGSIGGFLRNKLCVSTNKWYSWDCVKGNCSDCHVDAQLLFRNMDADRMLTWVRFGKGVNSRNPTKVDASRESQSLVDFIKFYKESLQKYLFHWNHLLWNKHHHERFWLNDTSTTYLFADFAENPKQTFLQEAQFLYYTKKTIYLHNTVMYRAQDDGTDFKKKYIHHLSDDKSHNADQVFVILRDIIQANAISGCLVLCSDNCSVQYKCAKAFASYRQLAMDHQLDIIRTYGVPQHGKGEVDAAGGGVKMALRDAALHEEKFFSNAEDAKQIVEEKFMAKNGKVDRDLIIQLVSNQKRKQGLKIKGSRATYFYHYYPNGDVITAPMVCSCEQCLIKDYDNCRTQSYKFIAHGNNVDLIDVLEEESVEYEDDGGDEDDDQDDDNPEVLRTNNMLKSGLAAIDSYVAIKASSKSTDLMWFGQVVSLQEETFTLTYLKQKGETKNNFLFSLSKNTEGGINYACIVYPDIKFTYSMKAELVLAKDLYNEISFAALQAC